LKVLYLCHRVPYPPNRGDRITTSRQLFHLKERYDVTCLTFTTESGDAAAIAELERRGIRMVVDEFRDVPRRIAALPWLATSTPMTLRCFASAKLARAAREAARGGLGLIVAYSSCMAQFVEDIDVPRIMVFGDLDSEKWLEYSQEKSGVMGWVYAREARTLLDFERRVARGFEVSTVASEAEALTFREKTGVTPETLGNGVDLERFSPNSKIPRDPRLVVFTGIMDYWPNVESCVRFAKQILPRIRAEIPDVKFRIVGAQPSRAVRELAGPGVEVTGIVPETADHLREASVAVAPLRLGRGLQNKVLEAMACATPLVATDKAVAGVERHARAEEHFLRANSDEDFSASVIRLLRNPDEARALGGRARTLMEQRYAWEPMLRTFDRAIELALERHQQKRKTQ
jgi:sugar transferase (PEP-CTERM/EpsH1 system associated)